ncbi:MAG: nucleotidyltransferase [Bacteroidales bacterium]|nr:nucleotidyltransferase [Bacteroidales bacterium]
MKPTLLVLAAGMGSRYGALKQMDGVGPNNESILDYSVFDAKRSGFGKVVFVIRDDFAEAFKRINNSDRYNMPVEYVFQSTDKLPKGCSIMPNRTKPWGTAHAVLMSKDIIREPFAVINADDFYGRDAFSVMAKYLNECKNKQGEYSMIAYKLKNTLSDFGTVSRGICVQDDRNFLVSVIERTNIEKTNNGAQYKENNEQYPLDLDSLVSMNFWGFTPDFFLYCEEGFKEFLKQNSAPDNKAEYFIPLIVNKLIKNHSANVKVLRSDAEWFGVTYQEDKAGVKRKISELIDNGMYPNNLW